MIAIVIITWIVAMIILSIYGMLNDYADISGYQLILMLVGVFGISIATIYSM
jgi:hypothetical protein